MSKLILFPAQGAQYNEMAKDLYHNNSDARKLLDTIFSLVDYDLKEIMFSNSDDRLNDTQYTQPALFAHSLAVLKATNIKGDFLLGNSLGELPALVHAGVLSLEDGVKAVVKRGQLMSETKAGKMAAVIGMDRKNLEDLCKELSDDNEKVSPANINTRDQIVVSGDASKVDAFIEVAKSRGARRVIPLKVSGAFHSHLMEDAKMKFREILEDIDRKNLEDLCKELSDDNEEVSPANINTRDQIVVSGDASKVDAFIEVAKSRGARRVIPLKVSGAFHSHLMEDAKMKFREFLEDIEFKESKSPVIQYVSIQGGTYKSK